MAHPTAGRILVTGGAGFIGSHLIDALLKGGNQVVAFDNFNSFYDPQVKRLNISQQIHDPKYALVEGDIRDHHALKLVFDRGPFDTVVHLAAMAGVRPSLSNPDLYIDVNVLGTQRLIDYVLKQDKLPKFIFGSSSSVYGGRSGGAFSEDDRVDRPLSPYAASKAAAELICYAAHHTRDLPVTALRFFTVYGPRQRPDLAIHKFLLQIESGQVVELYGNVQSARDYTYVTDIVSGITAAIDIDLPSGYEIINLGRSQPVALIDMVKAVERALGKEAQIAYKDARKGDVPYTHAKIDKARALLNYDPKTSFDDGVRRFVEWHHLVKQKLASVTGSS
jgi:UDP-glucuronate 4-epimerase